jgi:ornithine carbamoyltransferase
LEEIIFIRHDLSFYDCLSLYTLNTVINALSDLHHPLQTLADLMTLKEHFGTLKGKTVAWVGDGNNVLHDLMIGSIKLGMNVRVATPTGYSADINIINQAKALALQEGVELVFTTDPKVAVKGSNVIVTDTWISMGQEEEAKKRKIDFAGYQVMNRTSCFIKTIVCLNMLNVIYATGQLFLDV